MDGISQHAGFIFLNCGSNCDNRHHALTLYPQAIQSAVRGTIEKEWKDRWDR